MSSFGDFEKSVVSGAETLAKDMLKGLINEAATDAKDFLKESEQKLKRWTNTLATEKLTKDEFSALVDCQKRHAIS
jgi:hypothetical protein